MKKFARHRSYKEIRKACKAAGFAFSDAKFNRGSDYITFTFVHGRVSCMCCYSTVTGTCFGELKGVPKADWFCTDEETFEKRPWFRALLDFIYVSEAAVVSH